MGISCERGAPVFVLWYGKAMLRLRYDISHLRQHGTVLQPESVSALPLPSEKATPRSFSVVIWKPGPNSSHDCFICTKFARQWNSLRPSETSTDPENTTTRRFEQTWHIQDSQDKDLVLNFIQNNLNPLSCFLIAGQRL